MVVRAWILESVYPERHWIRLAPFISKDVRYLEESDTLIVWTEQNGTDMALSFERPEGCARVLAFILFIQRRFQDGQVLHV